MEPARPVNIIEIGPKYLTEYAFIPIKFEVKSTLQVELINDGLVGMLLCQIPVEKPYVKDYDSYGDLPT